MPVEHVVEESEEPVDASPAELIPWLRRSIATVLCALRHALLRQPITTLPVNLRGAKAPSAAVPKHESLASTLASLLGAGPVQVVWVFVL